MYNTCFASFNIILDFIIYIHQIACYYDFKSRNVNWAGQVACVRWREIYNRLVEENEGKRLIKRNRSRWEKNINIYIRNRVQDAD
jgi:hypothetical protein